MSEIAITPAAASPSSPAPPVEKRSITANSSTAAHAAPAAETAPSAATAGAEASKPDAAKPPESEKKPETKEFVALRRERQRLEAEKQAAAKAKAEADAVVAEAAKYKEAVASKDIKKLMGAFGLTAEQVVDLFIAEESDEKKEPEKPAEESPLAKEIKELRERLEAKEKAEETARTQAQVDRIMGEISAEATKDSAKYPLVSAPAEVMRALTADGDKVYTSGPALVFDVMLAHWEAKKEYLTYPQALELVQTHLAAAKSRISAALGGDKPQAEQSAASPAVNGSGAKTPTLDERIRAAVRPPRPTNAAASGAPVVSTKVASKADAERKFERRVAEALAKRGVARA